MKKITLCTLLVALLTSFALLNVAAAKPNVVFLLADQWRAQSTGYAGEKIVQTPNLDALAKESANFVNAVSTMPVCSPYRGSLMTGQYANKHGVFLNDVQLPPAVVSIAEVYKEGGYQTAYIGKWHLDARGRSSFTPPERRQGFDFWRGLECTHNYNHSPYYADTPEKLFWKGYDAAAQTEEAVKYLDKQKESEKPFLLVLSWGPPHNPYPTAPAKFTRMYDPAKIELRGNVPANLEKRARKEIAGYYAHCTALDTYTGQVLAALKKTGLDKNTIVVFTSDHGDMLHSHGQHRKQRPWDESVRVPLLIRYPETLYPKSQYPKAKPVATEYLTPIGTPDLMPTLLGMCSLEIPKEVQGSDFSGLFTGKMLDDATRPALIACLHPFGEWERHNGGREYRGVRTGRYTYVKTLEGPWLLYDNSKDPLQQKNLIGDPAYAEIQKTLEKKLVKMLKEADDTFEPGDFYIKERGYKVNARGTMPYSN